MPLGRLCGIVRAGLRALATGDRGQAVPEYALVTALFSLVAIAALVAVGTIAAMQLVGTQGRVQTAAIAAPTP